MKTLFAHIGRAKTGTSALQSFLCWSSDVLRQHGVKYAETALFHQTHHPLAWSLHKEASDVGKGKYWDFASRYAHLDRSPERYWTDLRREIETSPEQTFVVSSEEFGVVLDLKETAPLMVRHLTGIQLKFVVYLRRQDEFLQSVYNQAVKGDEARFKGDFWKYVQPILDVGGADCMKVLSPLAKAVGDENVIVRVYEKQQLRGSLFEDFLDAIGISDTAGFTFPDHPANPKLDPRALEVVRRINRIPMDTTLRRKLINRVQARWKGSDAFATHSLLSPTDRKNLLQRFEASNAEAARRFLGRTDGRLFLSPLPQHEEWTAAMPTGEEALDLMTDLWKLFLDSQTTPDPS